MASLLEKVGTLINANLHAMVDVALKANSPAVMDQYIRQIEDNLDALEDAAATVGGGIKTLGRKRDDYRAKAAQFDRDIDQLLLAGRDDLATAADQKLRSTQRLAEQYSVQYDRQQAEYQSLLNSRRKLEARLEVIKQEREELLALLELAKSKEITVKTIRSLDDLAGLGDEDITKMGDSIRARLDKADAALGLQTESLESEMSKVLGDVDARRRLDDRKARLGLTSAEPEAPETIAVIVRGEPVGE